MLDHVFWLLLGLGILLKGAEYLVDASARLARRLGVSDLVVGLTFVAIGTSLPELASSLVASLEGYPTVVTGNVVGSNIANIGLILGLAAAVHSLKVKKRMFMRDGYIFLFSVILLFGFVIDGEVARWEGLLLLLFYVAYLVFLIKTREQRVKKYRFRDFLDYFFEFRYVATIRSTMIRSAMKKEEGKTVTEKKTMELFKQGIVADVLLILVSGVAIAFGAKYLVEEAVFFGDYFLFPPSVVGLTVIAIGTSLPELMVSIQAARKGLGEMVVGNVIGSNISNALFIYGLSAAITPIPVGEMTITYTVPIMSFFSVFLLYAIRTQWKLAKRQGAIMVALYVAFIFFALTNGWY